MSEFCIGAVNQSCEWNHSSIHASYYLILQTMLLCSAFVNLIMLHSSLGLIRVLLVKDHVDYHLKIPGRSRRGNAITGQRAHVLQLNNFFNLQYSGRMWLGTPPQEFRILLDTGSADLWVFSSKCSLFDHSCRQHKQYDSSLSSSYQADGKEVSLGYLKGSIDGFISTDVLWVAGLLVVNQSFIEVTGEPEDAYSNTDFDGILGLGLQALSRSRVNTPLNNMISQGLIKPVFSILLNRNDEEGSGGELILGGWDTSKFLPKTLNTMLVTKPVYWQVAMDGVAVGEEGQVYCSETCEVVFDTGSSLIMGPADQLKQIYQELSSHIYEEDGLAMVNCGEVNYFPDIVFFIHGQKYKLTSNDYVLRDESGFDEVCVIGMGGLSEKQTDLWILGDVFLRKYYSIFDLENKTVSLAHIASNV